MQQKLLDLPLRESLSSSLQPATAYTYLVIAKKNKASFEYVRHSDYLIFALLNQVSRWCTVGPLQINPVNNSKGLTKQLLIFVNGDGKSAGTRKHNWVLLPNIHSRRSMQKVYYKIALTRIIFLVVSRRESNIELVISGIFDIARERAIEWVSEWVSDWVRKKKKDLDGSMFLIVFVGVVFTVCKTVIRKVQSNLWKQQHSNSCKDCSTQLK